MSVKKLSVLLFLLFSLSAFSIEKIDGDKSILRDKSYDAIEVQKGAVLRVGKGVKLSLKASSKVSGELILEEGASLEFNFKDAGALDILSGGVLRINGSEKKPCKVFVKKGGAVAYISDGKSNGGGSVVAKFCEFNGLGGAPLYKAVETWVNSYSPGLIFENCQFVSCAQIKHRYHLPAGAIQNFDSCKWIDSVEKPKSERSQYEEWYILEVPAHPGSEGSITNCDFDKRIGFFHAADFVLENNVLREGIKIYAHWCPKWKSFKNNFILSVVDGEEIIFSYGNSIKDCVFVKDTKSWNPHFIGIGNGEGEAEVSGSIFWFIAPDKSEKSLEGDGLMVGDAKSGRRESNVCRIEGNIVLPNSYGLNKKQNLSTTLLTILNSSNNSTIEIVNNTIFNPGGGGLHLGETNTCNVGTINAVHSNLFVGENNQGYKIKNLGHTEADVITYENTSHNASWNLEQGDLPKAKGYLGLKFSSEATVGEYDVDDVDPQFVDMSRTPFTWAQGQGGKGDIESVMDLLSKSEKNKVQDLIDYIREGWRPRNKALQNAGKDGGYVGAVPISGSKVKSNSSNKHKTI